MQYAINIPSLITRKEEKNNSLRLNQSTLQPYGPTCPL